MIDSKWWALLSTLVAFGCSSDSDATSSVPAGGHTNWLTCSDLDDCEEHPEAVACEGGYCVDANGERVTAGSAGSGGTPGSGGSAGVGPGGTSGTGASGGTPSGGTATAGTSGSAGASAGAPNGGIGGSGGQPPLGGAGGSAGTGTCAGIPEGCGELGSPCCDPYPCDGPNFCNGTLACCGDGTCKESCNAPLVVPDCPGDTTAHCAGTSCVAGAVCLECPVGQTCVEIDYTCGPGGGTSATCIDDPCAGETLDCSCASATCDGIGVAPWTCDIYQSSGFDPYLRCFGGFICASPDTPIATPSGDVPIAELSEGDLVYSIHDSAIQVVPLLGVARTPVVNHHVLRVGVSGGTTLEISGPHPVADGRRLDELTVGDVLDGNVVESVERIPYVHAHTYDILPASDTRTYLSGGVWLGTTIAPR